MLFVFLCFFLRPEQARAAQGSPEQPRAAQSSQGQFRCGCIAEILIFYCVALCFLELDLSFHVIKPNLPRKPFPPAPDPLKIIQNHLWQASQPASSGHCLFVCFFCFFVFFVVVGVGVCVNGCCHHNTTHHNTTQHIIDIYTPIHTKKQNHPSKKAKGALRLALHGCEASGVVKTFLACSR